MSPRTLTRLNGSARPSPASQQSAAPPPPRPEELFQRSLTAHLPPRDFERLQSARVLVAGLGGGSNIAELLARKGVGHLIIADPDHYEAHNIRQRGSLASTLMRRKVDVMAERLRDINPAVQVESVPEGVTMENTLRLVENCDFVVDMVDFSAVAAKVTLYRAARRLGRIVVTAPSIVNGAILYVFTPDGVAFEDFFGYREGAEDEEQKASMLKRLIPRFAPEAPESMYLEACAGKRTLPLDAVGVDQAAVLAVAALENLILGRHNRVVTVPRGIQVDVSDPAFLARIVDFSADFRRRPR